METSPFLALPQGLFITHIQEEATTLTVSAASTNACSYCPLCKYPASSVHSHYYRTLSDLPCGGRRVLLRLNVR